MTKAAKKTVKTTNKKVAKTITSILDDPTFQKIQDRSSDIEPLMDEVLKYWEIDMYKRRPSMAMDEAGIKTTDLDLVSALFALKDRGAVINLPKYKAMRKTVLKEGEHVVSKDNRHGKILNISGAEKTFSFGVLIEDMNVMTTDGVGAFRRFNLTNLEGKWYDGWKCIEFLPDENENAFLAENELWTGNSVRFDNFVHPNWWVSFYGQYYLKSKRMIERISEQFSDTNKQLKAMKEKIKFVAEGNGTSKKSDSDYGTKEVGKTKKVEINAFEVRLEMPEFEGEFPVYEANVTNLKKLEKLLKKMRSTKSKLMFMCRAIELAHYQAKNRFPSWIKGAKWEKGYKPTPRAKNEWERLILFQPKVGERGVSILRREFAKTETVDSNY